MYIKRSANKNTDGQNDQVDDFQWQNLKISWKIETVSKNRTVTFWWRHEPEVPGNSEVYQTFSEKATQGL